MHAAVLTAAINPYHPPHSSSAPLDVLLVTIGLIILTLLIVIPAHQARARELHRLSQQQPPVTVPPEATTSAPH